MTDRDTTIAREIVRLLRARAPDASICPSDAARSLAPREDAWRALMPRVREVACRMATDGVLVITQGDAVLDPAVPPQGAIRLRRGAGFDRAR